MNFLALNEEDQQSLMNPFSEEEIRKLVWAMPSNKAPGPDGFSIIFFLKIWEACKEDVHCLFSRILLYNVFLHRPP